MNGNEQDTSVPDSGAVYVFTRTVTQAGAKWSQQAYVEDFKCRPATLAGPWPSWATRSWSARRTK